MAANCRYNWESIADFRPPSSYRYQHIPIREIKNYDRAAAQRTNNATIALRHPCSKIEATKRYIEKHILQFHLEVIFIPKSVWIGKRSHESTRSQLERLPDNVLKRICERINCTVDVVCLMLSSATMAQQLVKISPVGIGVIDKIDIERGCSQLAGYIELIHRLSANWMPPNYAFCHHCLRYMPRLNFDPVTWKTALCCITCRTTGRLDVLIGGSDSPDLQLRHSSCHGCQILEQTMEDLTENLSDRDLEESTAAWRWPACANFCIVEEAGIIRKDPIDETSLAIETF